MAHREQRRMRFLERGDPGVRAQHDLEEALKAKRTSLDNKVARLKEAESELTECRATVERTALGDDKAKLKTALQAKREAEDDVAALNEAAATIRKDIVAVEAEIERVVDGRMRGETAAAINTMIEQFEETAAEYDTATRAYISAAKELGLLVAEARGIAAFLELERVQLPPENAVAVREAKNYSAAVLNGARAPSLPQAPKEPPKLVVVPPAPTLNIFALKNLKFVNDAGAVICIGGKKRSDVPEALGRLAISSGLALPISDPRCRDIGYNASPFQPDEANCEWLGKPGREVAPRFGRPGPAPIHSSLTQFEPLDRGPAYPATFSRPAEPEPEPLAVGARNADEGGES
jgi:hypothetical protein